MTNDCSPRTTAITAAPAAAGRSRLLQGAPDQPSPAGDAEQIGGAGLERLEHRLRHAAPLPLGPQHAVALAAQHPRLRAHDVARHVVELEHVREDLDRGLELLRDHLVGARAPQLLDLLHHARAHDDVDRGVQGSRQRDREPRRVRIGDGVDHDAGAIDADVLLDLAPRGVAVDDRHALRARFLDRDRVELDYDVRDARLAQHLHQQAAVHPVADHHHVSRARRVGGRRRLHR